MLTSNVPRHCFPTASAPSLNGEVYIEPRMIKEKMRFTAGDLLLSKQQQLHTMYSVYTSYFAR